MSDAPALCPGPNGGGCNCRMTGTDPGCPYMEPSMQSSSDPFVSPAEPPEAAKERADVCAKCPTLNTRYGLPLGECPVCGSFWVVTWGATAYCVARISGEEYRRWMSENGYGVQPNGRTVPVPALQVLPNVTWMVAGGVRGR